jgi:phytoene dehydrogenase-like protein
VITIIPTAADPTQAPDGQDTIWSWTGISPAHPRVPWSEIGEAAGDAEIARAARYLPGLEERIIDRQVMTPAKFEQRFRSPDGNVYHVDPTATRFGPLRPAHGLAGYRAPIQGLFLSGAGTHPSAGICGVPGRQAARVALRALGESGGRSATRTARAIGGAVERHIIGAHGEGERAGSGGTAARAARAAR